MVDNGYKAPRRIREDRQCLLSGAMPTKSGIAFTDGSPWARALYLEGQKILDVTSGERAEAIQVKDTKGSGSVTLRSGTSLRLLDIFGSFRSTTPM